MKSVKIIVPFLLTFSLLSFSSCGFQSDELLVDDEEFGLEGSPRHRSPETVLTRSPPVTRKRHSDLDSDSKIQFSLDHAFGDSDFSPAGTFSARLKTWSHGGQSLTKLRFSRNSFTDEDKEKFKNLLKSDDFYRIRLPSNVLSPPGRDFVISSVKARCLPREGLDEHFVIHMEGVNVLAVNYGSPGSCPYPRNLKFPAKWSFNSHTVLKNSEQAPRAPVFTEEILGGENAEGEVVQPPERSFWAKYWMYLIPLGLIVMNAVTQAMNMPEEQATGQVPAQGQPSAGAVQRGPSSAARRR
ncbi:putative ATP binding protein [Hibiscus syriacus]|uniref:ER membrane protein complex subunit 10 n=1 Tax=Hibiscus syriacus TaxID=106335 RepID=A0A6A3BDH3_HIBSY|nr:ER membrane protein complex subunit 10-like [Hibiscus syriacus]KAE8714663.1 putative ATP binding protein [Hibiscus syriacus]